MRIHSRWADRNADTQIVSVQLDPHLGGSTHIRSVSVGGWVFVCSTVLDLLLMLKTEDAYLVLFLSADTFMGALAF